MDTVLVIGATGQQGGATARALRARHPGLSTLDQWLADA